VKLKDLQPGDLFQFARNPKIHRVLNPETGLFKTVGQFYRGVPRQLCFYDTCIAHETAGIAPVNAPLRAVKKIAWEKYSDAYAWSTDADEVHRRLLAEQVVVVNKSNTPEYMFRCSSAGCKEAVKTRTAGDIQAASAAGWDVVNGEERCPKHSLDPFNVGDRVEVGKSGTDEYDRGEVLRVCNDGTIWVHWEVADMKYWEEASNVRPEKVGS
jgi:hypothetical protein